MSPEDLVRPSSIAIRWLALSSFVAVFAATAWVVLSVDSADAQPTEDAELTFAVSHEDATTGARTATIGLDPGTSNLAAIGAGFRYDQDLVTVLSCAVSEAGACNDVGGLVRFSVFNLTGLSANERLLTVEFTPVEGATATTTFELEVDTAIDFNGVSVIEPVVHPIEVSLAPVERGALTGDVVDQSSATGLFGLQVCVTHNATEHQTCTTTTGLGTWRIDDLTVGEHTVEITDPNDVYSPTTLTATVAANEVAAGIDASLTLITDAAVTDEPVTEEPAAGEEPIDVDEPAVADAADQDGSSTTTVTNAASITGTVLAPDTLQPVEGVQVCATQLGVSLQSCSATNGDGEYVLTGVATGHYWVTTVDPLGRFGDAKARLVGVIRDDVTRSGVRMVLTPVN